MPLEHGNAHNPCCTETFHFPIITVQDSLFSTEKFNTPSTQMSSISLCSTRKGLTSYSCAIIFHIPVSSTFLLRHWNVQHFHHVTEMFNIPMSSLRCPTFLWYWDVQYSYEVTKMSKISMTSLRYSIFLSHQELFNIPVTSLRCSIFLSRHWDVSIPVTLLRCSKFAVTSLRCSTLLSRHWDIHIRWWNRHGT